MSDAGWAHTHVERVRFGDLDAMRHLNNVVFLRYFETARIAMLGKLLADHDPSAPGDQGFIFAECHIVYRSPGHFDEEIAVNVRPADLRRSSFRIEFEMRGGDGRMVAEGWGALVSYDYAAGRAVPIDPATAETLRRVAPAPPAEVNP